MKRNKSVRRSKKALKRAISKTLGSKRDLQGLGGDKDYWMTRSAHERTNASRRLTKAQRQVRAQKAAADRRVAKALAKYLQQSNPGRKVIGAEVTKLKGGGRSIRPIFGTKRKSR